MRNRLILGVGLLAASLMQPAARGQQPAQVCGGDVRCAEVNSFAARIVDFRTSNIGRTKVVTAYPSGETIWPDRAVRADTVSHERAIG
jgi:hypothetical protein